MLPPVFQMLPQLPAGGWIKFLLEIPDEDIAAYAGLDSLVFIRFYKVRFQLVRLWCSSNLGAEHTPAPLRPRSWGSNCSCRLRSSSSCFWVPYTGRAGG